MAYNCECIKRSFFFEKVPFFSEVENKTAKVQPKLGTLLREKYGELKLETMSYDFLYAHEQIVNFVEDT